MRKNLLIALCAFAFACSADKDEKPMVSLSDQELKFEIYDSLVVDYLGSLVMMDISPDGQTYLLLDQNNSDIFTTDAKGEIIAQFNREGDGPENYSGSRMGLAQFVSNESFFIPTMLGFYVYDLEGNLQSIYKPDFGTNATLIVGNSKNSLFHEGKIYSNLEDRAYDEGAEPMEYHSKATKVEVVNLADSTWTPSVPFPAKSRFSSPEDLHPTISFYTNIAIRDDSLYVTFRNEPILYSYALSNLESPVLSRTIPFDFFQLADVIDPEDQNSFRIRDFFTGTINSVKPMGNNQFMIDYLTGLPDDKADPIVNGGSDFGQMFADAMEENSGGLAIYDGKSLSPIIEKEELLGTMGKFVSTDEIWFSLNFEEVENDYSVLYKTRLVEKE